jgi:hypothetical protein
VGDTYEKNILEPIDECLADDYSIQMIALNTQEMTQQAKPLAKLLLV